MQLTRVEFPESALPQVYVEISTWGAWLYYDEGLVLSVVFQNEDESSPAGGTVALESLREGEVFDYETEKGEKLFFVMTQRSRVETHQIDEGDRFGGEFILSDGAEIEGIHVGIGVFSTSRKQRVSVIIKGSSVEAGKVCNVPLRVKEDSFKRLLRAG